MNLKDLKRMKIQELSEIAKDLGIENENNLRKQELIFAILNEHTKNQAPIFAEGVLECLSDGFGFLRSQDYNYLPSPDDVYVSPSQIRRFSLKTGDTVSGQIRAPKETERYFALLKVEQINFESADMPRPKIIFDNLTPKYPDVKFDFPKEKDLDYKMIELIAPLAKGHRSLIIGGARTGKSTLLRKLANGIIQSNPNAFVMTLLLSERPEEISVFEQNIKGELISSTFDETANRHVQIAEMALEKAKRLVENQKDVVILLDSINRLTYAYQEVLHGNKLSIALDAMAIQKTKRFFSAARTAQEGGSLTIIATAATQNERLMDDLIVDELKEVVNHKIELSSQMVQQNLYPAIDIKKSFSRKDELLYEKGTLTEIKHFKLALEGMNLNEGHALMQELLNANHSITALLNRVNQALD